MARPGSIQCDLGRIAGTGGRPGPRAAFTRGGDADGRGCTVSGPAAGAAPRGRAGLARVTGPLRDRVAAAAVGLFTHGDYPLARTLDYPGRSRLVRAGLDDLAGRGRHGRVRRRDPGAAGAGGPPRGRRRGGGPLAVPAGPARPPDPDRGLRHRDLVRGDARGGARGGGGPAPPPAGHRAVRARRGLRRRRPGARRVGAQLADRLVPGRLPGLRDPAVPGGGRRPVRGRAVPRRRAAGRRPAAGNRPASWPRGSPAARTWRPRRPGGRRSRSCGIRRCLRPSGSATALFRAAAATLPDRIREITGVATRPGDLQLGLAAVGALRWCLGSSRTGRWPWSGPGRRRRRGPGSAPPGRPCPPRKAGRRTADGLSLWVIRNRGSQREDHRPPAGRPLPRRPAVLPTGSGRRGPRAAQARSGHDRGGRARTARGAGPGSTGPEGPRQELSLAPGEEARLLVEPAGTARTAFPRMFGRDGYLRITAEPPR